MKTESLTFRLSTESKKDIKRTAKLGYRSVGEYLLMLHEKNKGK